MKIVREAKCFDLFCKIKHYRVSDMLPFHWHDNYEMCQVVNNPCSFRIDGKLINAAPGDIVAISEKTVHQFIIHEDNSDIRVIQFNSNILFGITDKIVPLKTHIPYCEIQKNTELEKSLDSLFGMMESEENIPDSAGNNYYKAITAALYFLLQQNFAESGLVRSGKDRKGDFYSIVEYINTHFAENITVNSISEHFYFSRGKLSSVFKKYAGISINDYINQLRVKNVNMLLLKGESITNAALSCGFDSIRTFNNCYKKVMGMTPSEYMKSR